MVSQTLTVLPMTHKPIAPQPRTQMSTRSFMGEAFVVTGLVLFACWLRVYLAQGGTFGSDVDDWITWSHALTNSPPSTFYARTNSDYLPGYPSILWLLGVMYPFVHSAVSHTFGWHINQMMFLVTYFKMPAITADLATIITIYIAGRRWTTWRRALVAASIYAINPAIIFNSARWGQVDSVSALFLVLAVVFLVEDLPLWCGFLLAVSIMTKPTAIVLVPLVIVMYARQKRLTRLILALSTLTLTSLLIAWPYKPATMSPITFIFQRFTTTATKWPVTSMNAFNLWALFNHDLGQHAMIFRLDSTHWLGLSLHLWGFMLLSALVAVLMVALAFIGVPDKKTQRAQVVVPLAATLTFAFFLVLTRMHERHLLPVLPLMALQCITMRRYWPVYLMLSMDYMLNLYFAYPSVAYFPLPSLVMNNAAKVVVSLVNVTAFGVCLALLIGPIPVVRQVLTSGRTTQRHKP